MERFSIKFQKIIATYNERASDDPEVKWGIRKHAEARRELNLI